MLPAPRPVVCAAWLDNGLLRAPGGMETTMKTTIDACRIVALILSIAACSLSPAKGEEVGVWKPTGFVGGYAPAGAVAFGPGGDVWTFLPSPDGSRSLVRSRDGGASWTTVTLQTSSRTLSTRTLIADSQNRVWLYVADWGLSHFSSGGDLLTTTGLAEALGDSTRMIESPDGYLYRTRFAGYRQVLDRIGVNGDVRTTASWPWTSDIVKDLQADAKGALYILGSILSRSTDGGLTWTKLFSVSDYAILFDWVCVEPDGTLYVCRDIYRSTDDGKTWVHLPQPDSGLLQSPLRSLPDGSIAGTFCLYDWDLNRYRGGPSVSRDKGMTWTEFMPGIEKDDLDIGVVLAASGDGVVYAYFQFLGNKASQNGLYQMVLPRAGADKAWTKY